MPFFGGGAGIQVIGKDLVTVVQPVVYAHLLAVKVSVTERRSHIHDGTGLEVVDVLGADEGLQLRQREREESRVAGADQQGLVAVFVAAGHEGHQNQLLAGQSDEYLEGIERMIRVCIEEI